MHISHLLGTNLQISARKSGNTQISVRPILGQLQEPLFLDQVRSTLCEMRGNSGAFCLHMDNMKFNTQHEERIRKNNYIYI